MKIQIKGVTNTNFEIKKGGFYSNFGDSLTPQVLNILITELKENPIHIFLERKEQVDLFSKLYLDIPKFREFVECLNQPDLERLIMDKVKSRDHVIIIPSHPTLMDFAELPLIDGIYHENCFESVFLNGVNKTFSNFISLEAFYKSINFRFSDWDLDVFINELNEEIRAVEFDFNINLIHKDSVLSEVKNTCIKLVFLKQIESLNFSFKSDFELKSVSLEKFIQTFSKTGLFYLPKEKNRLKGWTTEYLFIESFREIMRIFLGLDESIFKIVSDIFVKKYSNDSVIQNELRDKFTIIYNHSLLKVTVNAHSRFQTRQLFFDSNEIKDPWFSILNKYNCFKDFIVQSNIANVDINFIDTESGPILDEDSLSRIKDWISMNIPALLLEEVRNKYLKQYSIFTDLHLDDSIINIDTFKSQLNTLQFDSSGFISILNLLPEFFSNEIRFEIDEFLSYPLHLQKCLLDQNSEIFVTKKYFSNYLEYIISLFISLTLELDQFIGDDSYNKELLSKKEKMSVLSELFNDAPLEDHCELLKNMSDTDIHRSGIINSKLEYYQLLENKFLQSIQSIQLQETNELVGFSLNVNSILSVVDQYFLLFGMYNPRKFSETEFINLQKKKILIEKELYKRRSFWIQLKGSNGEEFLFGRIIDVKTKFDPNGDTYKEIVVRYDLNQEYVVYATSNKNCAKFLLDQNFKLGAEIPVTESVISQEINFHFQNVLLKFDHYQLVNILLNIDDDVKCHVFQLLKDNDRLVSFIDFLICETDKTKVQLLFDSEVLIHWIQSSCLDLDNVDLLSILLKVSSDIQNYIFTRLKNNSRLVPFIQYLLWYDDQSKVEKFYTHQVIIETFKTNPLCFTDSEIAQVIFLLKNDDLMYNVVNQLKNDHRLNRFINYCIDHLDPPNILKLFSYEALFEILNFSNLKYYFNRFSCDSRFLFLLNHLKKRESMSNTGTIFDDIHHDFEFKQQLLDSFFKKLESELMSKPLDSSLIEHEFIQFLIDLDLFKLVHFNDGDIIASLIKSDQLELVGVLLYVGPDSLLQSMINISPNLLLQLVNSEKLWQDVHERLMNKFDRDQYNQILSSSYQLIDYLFKYYLDLENQSLNLNFFDLLQGLLKFYMITLDDFDELNQYILAGVQTYNDVELTFCVYSVMMSLDYPISDLMFERLSKNFDLIISLIPHHLTFDWVKFFIQWKIDLIQIQVFSESKHEYDIFKYLGDMYLDTTISQHNEFKAKSFYQIAADNNNMDAQLQLGLMYENGRGGEKDVHLAITYYEKASTERENRNGEIILYGLAHAQYILGCIYYTGKHIKKDEFLGLKYFTKAAEQGHIDSQYELGKYYKSQLKMRTMTNSQEWLIQHNVFQNSEKWFLDAANNGHIDSAYCLGCLYLEVKLVGGHYSMYSNQSVKWFEIAAKEGHLFAQNKLAKLYQSYYLDDEQACFWFQQIADQDCLEIQSKFTEQESLLIYDSQYELAHLVTNLLESGNLPYHPIHFNRIYFLYFKLSGINYKSSLIKFHRFCEKYLDRVDFSAFEDIQYTDLLNVLVNYLDDDMTLLSQIKKYITYSHIAPIFQNANSEGLDRFILHLVEADSTKFVPMLLNNNLIEFEYESPIIVDKIYHAKIIDECLNHELLFGEINFDNQFRILKKLIVTSIDINMLKPLFLIFLKDISDQDKSEVWNFLLFQRDEIKELVLLVLKQLSESNFRFFYNELNLKDNFLLTLKLFSPDETVDVWSDLIPNHSLLKLLLMFCQEFFIAKSNILSVDFCHVLNLFKSQLSSYDLQTLYHDLMDSIDSNLAINIHNRFWIDVSKTSPEFLTDIIIPLVQNPFENFSFNTELKLLNLNKEMETFELDKLCINQDFQYQYPSQNKSKVNGASMTITPRELTVSKILHLFLRDDLSLFSEKCVLSIFDIVDLVDDVDPDNIRVSIQKIRDNLEELKERNKELKDPIFRSEIAKIDMVLDKYTNNSQTLCLELSAVIHECQQIKALFMPFKSDLSSINQKIITSFYSFESTFQENLDLAHFMLQLDTPPKNLRMNLHDIIEYNYCEKVNQYIDYLFKLNLSFNDLLQLAKFPLLTGLMSIFRYFNDLNQLMDSFEPVFQFNISIQVIHGSLRFMISSNDDLLYLLTHEKINVIQKIDSLSEDIYVIEDIDLFSEVMNCIKENLLDHRLNESNDNELIVNRLIDAYKESLMKHYSLNEDQIEALNLLTSFDQIIQHKNSVVVN